MTSLPDGFNFRELGAADLNDALQVIKRHNHDDFECAQHSYAKSLNGQFVLTNNNQVVGVTGARGIPGTNKTFWLSWTYLDPNAAMSLQNPGVIFDLICDQLQKRANARKLFAMISPTVDSGLGGGHSYGGALDSYIQNGFQSELTHSDYYDSGESMTILSRRLTPGYQPQQYAPDQRLIGIFDSDEIAETDDAYYLEWDFIEHQPAPENSIHHWIDTVRNWDGRVIFVGLPGNAEAAIGTFSQQGFRQDGILKDFYDDGLDEVRLRYDL